MKHVKNENSKCSNIRKIHKKGVVDVQFNWIFILIAGFVIFLFIISIVFTQKKHADTQSGIMAVDQITSLLKSKQQTSNVYSEISIPKSSIEFRCEPENKYFTYRVGDSERIQLPTYLMFAPRTITTNKIIVWTQAFDTGFPVAVFSYITVPDSIIIVYADDKSNSYGDAMQFLNNIPTNITRVITKNITKYDSYPHRTIVCFNTDCVPIYKTYDYINITPAIRGSYAYGNVSFHYKSNTNINNDVRLPYLTWASLYGAVFSNDPDYYSCQMSRALDHYEIKRSLLEKRMNYTYTALRDDSCATQIRVVLNTQINQIPNVKLSYDTFRDISNRASLLDNSNTDFGFSSCPRIY